MVTCCALYILTALFSIQFYLTTGCCHCHSKEGLSTLYTVLSISFKWQLFYFFFFFFKGLTVFHRLYLQTPYCKSKHNNEDLWCFYWWFLWFLAVSQDISTYTLRTLQYDCNYFSFLAKTLGQYYSVWEMEKRTFQCKDDL